jgi:hypothetical protein
LLQELELIQLTIESLTKGVLPVRLLLLELRTDLSQLLLMLLLLGRRHLLLSALLLQVQLLKLRLAVNLLHLL